MVEARIRLAPRIVSGLDPSDDEDLDTASVIAALARGNPDVLLLAGDPAERAVRLDRVIAALAPQRPRLIRVGKPAEGPITLGHILARMETRQLGEPAPSAAVPPKGEHRPTILVIEHAEAMDDAALNALRHLPELQILFVADPAFALRWKGTNPPVAAPAPRRSPRLRTGAIGVGLLGIGLLAGLGLFLTGGPKQAGPPEAPLAEPPPPPVQPTSPIQPPTAQPPAPAAPAAPAAQPPPSPEPAAAPAAAPTPAPVPVIAPSPVITPSPETTPPPDASVPDQQPARQRQDFEAFLAAGGAGHKRLTERQRAALFRQYLAWRADHPAAAGGPGH